MTLKLASGKSSDSQPLYFDILPENLMVDTNEALGLKGSFCLLAAVGTVTDDGKYILGNSFLRNFYTVYDYKNQKIGITLDKSNRDK